MRKAFRVDKMHDFVIDLKKQPDGTIKIYAPIAPPDPRGMLSRRSISRIQ